MTIINFVIVSYFILIYALNFYKIDVVLIGIFRELFTIPFLIGQIVFLVIGVKHLMNHKKHILTIISLLLLAACSVVTLGSFF